MTSERMKEIRFDMWLLARELLQSAANSPDNRRAMPYILDEEYEYACEFMRGIAKVTKPGNYRDEDQDESNED